MNPRYRLRLLGALFLISVGYGPSGSAQQPTGVEWLTTREGLSQGYVSCLLQDREGFLWVGTKNGLNRYDGYGFEVLINDPYNPHTLSHDYIHCLAEYGDFLLVGTLGGGLNILYKKNRQVFRIPNQLLVPPASEKDVEIGWVDVDADGNIWVELRASARPIGLFQIKVPQDFWQNPQAATNWQERLQIRSWPQVITGRSCLSPSRDLLFTPVGDTIFQIQTRTGQWSLRTLLPSSWVKELYCDASGRLWISRNGHGAEGLFRLGATGDPEPVPVPNGFKLLLDVSKNRIALALEASIQFFQLDAAGHFDPTKPEIPPLALPTNYTACLTDRADLIWVGSSGLGLLRINPRSQYFHHLFAGHSINGPILCDRQGMVCCFSYQPILLSTPARPPLEAFLLRLKQLYRFKLAQDAASANFWVLGEPFTTNTLVLEHFDATRLRQSYRVPEAAIREGCLALDRQGDPWIGIYGRLLHLNRAQAGFDSYDFRWLLSEGHTVNAMTETPEGHWWIGTDKGLVYARREVSGFAFSVYKNNPDNPNSLRNNNVASLLLDPQTPNVLWIGTKGGGLNRLDLNTLTFEHLTTRQGLPNDVIYGILADDQGNLWMSSNKGLIRYTPASGAIKNYMKEDGVQDNEFNTWAYGKSPDGLLLFGGVNGISAFDPRQLQPNPVAPPVHIHGLRLNDQYVDWNEARSVLHQAPEFTREITVPFSQNTLTLDFAALDFASPARNRFRYYLDGAEKPWAHETNEHSAAYLNLAPGRYVFRVQGANSDGVWNQTPAELYIRVLPPWYRTWWAYLFYVLAVGAAAYSFYRYQLGRKLEHAENIRLKELDSFKSRFFTNVTHEFRTPLTVILGMADRIEAGETIGQASRLIRRNGENLLRLINQILDLAKLESDSLRFQYIQGDVLDYLRYIAESLHSLANAKNVLLRVESTHASIVVDYDPERILQIIHNLLSNAIKFTPSGGQVRLSANLVEERGAGEMLVISVSDTGIGIAPEDLPKVFERFYQGPNAEQARAGGTGVGLSLTRELVRAMGGRIGVESTVGQGSCFTLHLPVTRRAERIQAKKTSVEADRPTLPRPSVAGAPANGSSGTTPHLLIVEDNPDVIEYLSGCLEGQYRLDYAYNGRAGIEKATETVPDIIISDVMMPEKDGLEVCDALKHDVRTSHVPIVLLTAKATHADRIAGLRRGADAYLAKPFHPEELLVTLANLLAQRDRLQTRYTVPGEPPAPTDDPGLQLEDAFLQKFRAVVETHLSDADLEMPRLERALAMSRSQIFRKIKALTGKSPSLYIRSIRLHHAKELLASSNLTISEIAYDTGFSSPQYFSDAFFEEFGLRPSGARR